MFMFLFVNSIAQSTPEKENDFESIQIIFQTNETPSLENYTLLTSDFLRPTNFMGEYCSFKGNILLHKSIAQKIGANLIFVRNVQYPENTIGNSKICYGFDAVYYSATNNIPETKNQDADNQYNVIIYRPHLKFLHAQKLNIKINNKPVCKMKNGTVCKLKLPKGEYKISSKREIEETITLSVDSNQTYYIRTGLMAGLFGPRPDLTVIDSDFAEFEMEKFKENN